MENLFYGINAIEFAKRFQNQSDCKAYLYAIKWQNGYSCKLCGCTDEVKGRTSFHRRCKGVVMMKVCFAIRYSKGCECLF